MPDLISSESALRIGADTRVTLHFSLILPGGEEIDTTRNGDPASFVMGDGSLLPGFETALVGLKAGDAEQILLPAAEAFGEHNPANVQIIRRERFADLELEEGLVVSFAAPDGELPGVVVALFEDTVKVDFNHPLSGTDITFDVAIINVEPAQASAAN